MTLYGVRTGTLRDLIYPGKNGSLERQAPDITLRLCGLPFKIMVPVPTVETNVRFECCRKRCLPMKAGSKAGDRNAGFSNVRKFQSMPELSCRFWR